MADDEIGRLRRVYQQYDRDPATLDRWAPDNPGNAFIVAERDTKACHALDHFGFWPPVGYPILEIGCGAGQILTRMRAWGAEASDLTGVDVVLERLHRARAAGHARLVQADGAALPFRDGTFRLVIAFTVMSSILDAHMEVHMASEMDRVLQIGGAVLWYDYRVSHPLNPHTRGVRLTRIRRLFPSFELALDTVTVVPQLARRLGRITRTVYPMLAKLKTLRTHHIGLLVKRRST